MKVHLLNVGWLTAPAGFWKQGSIEPRAPVRLPVPAYLVEHGRERLLIDTGLHPSAVADPASHYGAVVAATFRFEQDRSIADQVDLSSIASVVLTHLHFDHAGGLGLLPPSVPIIVQRAEWEAGADPAQIEHNFYCPRDYELNGREVVVVDGDHDLFGDGSVELLSTPGHTPGHQSVRVGDLVIGGDVAHFAGGLDDHVFPALRYDAELQARSALRLRQLRDDGLTVLPGHDPDELVPRTFSPERH